MNFESLTPRVPKNYLLGIAALVWTFAGGMLEYKGYSFMKSYPHFIVLKVVGCLFSGVLFFKLLFSGISGKHVARIINLPNENPCAFSFFNWRSYFLMGIMITSGITLRKTGLVSPEYLSLVYVTMGIPLLISSFRFYSSFFKRI